MSNRIKLKLLEHFVLRVPAYRLRFRSSVSRPTVESFFRLSRLVTALSEECQQPFTGEIEGDETMFGGKKKPGKRGWTARGKIIVLGIFKRDGQKSFSNPRPRRGLITWVKALVRSFCD